MMITMMDEDPVGEMVIVAVSKFEVYLQKGPIHRNGFYLHTAT